MPVIPSTSVVDMQQLAQLAGYAAAAFVAGLTFAIAGVRWWKRTVAPLLRAIQAEAKGANEAVNNIGPHDKTLRKTAEELGVTVSHHSMVLDRHTATLHEHTAMLQAIYDHVTKPEQR
jgi:hypothetical protein